MKGRKTIRNALIAIGLIVIASLVAHFYVQSQVYYAVVNFTTPEGLSITALLAETTDRGACGAANERFLTPIRQQCKGCKVTMARCARQLEGLELALSQDDPIPHYLVAALNVRMAIIGPPEIAKPGCETLAVELSGRGVRSAACISPGVARAKPGQPAK